MFYSHTQARAKLPKKRRRIMPVEHLPRSLAVRSNPNQLHHLSGSARPPATLAPANLASSSNFAYYAPGLVGSAPVARPAAYGFVAGTGPASPIAHGHLSSSLVPRGATLADPHSRTKINLSNKDLLPDCGTPSSPAESEGAASSALVPDTAALSQQQAKRSVQSDNGQHNGGSPAADCGRAGTEQAAFVRPIAKEADGAPSVEAPRTCEPAYCQQQQQATVASGAKQAACDGKADSSTCNLRNRRQLDRAGPAGSTTEATSVAEGSQTRLMENCSLSSTVSLDRKDSSDKSTVL